MGDLANQLYERVLVLRCQTGDETAFAELVGRHQQRLRYYLKRLLGNAEQVDDALQDTWFDVLKGIGKLKDSASFPAWLYRIARDRAYRGLRKQRPNQESIDGVVLESRDPSEDEFSADDAARIHRSLDRLRPEHREVLVLRFVEEMSYEHIAHVVGCRLGTVRSRLHYAKQALRREIRRSTDHD